MNQPFSAAASDQQSNKGTQEAKKESFVNPLFYRQGLCLKNSDGL
jgi:hypothetical protein